MSNWTYINGSVTISSFPFEIKKKKMTLPHPEKQIKLMMPNPCMKDDRPGLRIGVQIYSLPKCELSIKEEMSKLPCGEHEIINYNLSVGDDYSASTPLQGDVLSTVQKMVVDKYNEDFKVCFFTDFEYMNRLFPVEIGRANLINMFNLTINDSLRYCDASCLMTDLEACFVNLFSRKKMRPYTGYFEWYDCEDKHIYAIRFDNSTMKLMKLDSEDNRIVAFKLYIFKDRSMNITQSSTWEIPKKSNTEAENGDE